MKPMYAFRALLAAAAVLAVHGCAVHKDETPAPTGPSNFVVAPPPAGPTARFSVAPEKPTAGIVAVFDGTSSCPEGAFTGGCTLSDRSLVSFVWDFGDGTTASGPAASHRFRTFGSFSVRLTVVSDRGLSASTAKAVPVDPGVPPKPDFVFSPTNPAIGQSVSFNGSTSIPGPGHTIESYSWNFGDGGTASGETATHTFGTAGTYSVVLVVTDDLGHRGLVTKTVPIGSGGSTALVR